MKKLLNIIAAFSALAIMVLTSCKKDETRLTASMGSPGTLTASTTAPALSLSTASSTAVTFTWPATPVTGYNAPITYTIQVAVKGTNFANVQEIATSSLSQAVTGSDFNKALLALNLTTGTSAQVDVRIKSYIAPNAAVAYSNTLTLTVTPFSLTSYIYVPGDYQGWDPTTAPTLSSPTSNGVYEGKITFISTKSFEFKITPAPSWAVSYGGANGVLSTSGANLVAPSAGTYLIHVDMNALTYTLTKQ
ncbi:SusE domain-containing protein [Mucilaginibacter polytrichastri]|uniref:SusE outer membrane protein domain-containing protein n=1 Tax=Mucilaginibacter polytrichastri TaxID=1302689 RepID=A0A1Q5ZUR9_9SPHI|nr:SusE domain-containing protein [Mucilaginibacter polytrichastri]OKS85515.1 hypothetical protein RG47T_0961 [Mucilaginibacter polytrichastri]SFS37438.1 SusE outer membrane protein [Mucilaginibacter polytrichastri]